MRNNRRCNIVSNTPLSNSSTREALYYFSNYTISITIDNNRHSFPKTIVKDVSLRRSLDGGHSS